MFYEIHYAHFVENQNARNAKIRHTERNRTIEDLLAGKKTCPEETIYQFGTLDEHASVEDLVLVVTEFMSEFHERFGTHVHLLDWALHLDESTPHIHERHVFDCENKYGEVAPQQEKALEALGFELPDPDKPLSRRNNRKITFDAACRKMLFEIAKRHGLEFESYGVSDHVYEYRKQENEEDFKFFGRLCTLERAALTIYNGKLIAAYEPYLEAIEPAITIDTTGCYVECEDNSVLSYGSATVSCGPYTGTYKAPGENSRIWVPQKPIKCQSTLEAIRFAAGVLREKNKMLVCGSIEASLMPIYAPGIMVNILNRQAPSWSGAFYIYKVRHDYGKHKTKIFFRKKLEGY